MGKLNEEKEIIQDNNNKKTKGSDIIYKELSESNLNLSAVINEQQKQNDILMEQLKIMQDKIDRQQQKERDIAKRREMDFKKMQEQKKQNKLKQQQINQIAPKVISDNKPKPASHAIYNDHNMQNMQYKQDYHGQQHTQYQAPPPPQHINWQYQQYQNLQKKPAMEINENGEQKQEEYKNEENELNQFQNVYTDEGLNDSSNVKSLFDVDKPWNCRFCTFLNPADYEICALCFNEKPKKNENSNKHFIQSDQDMNSLNVLTKIEQGMQSLNEALMNLKEKREEVVIRSDDIKVNESKSYYITVHLESDENNTFGFAVNEELDETLYTKLISAIISYFKFPDNSSLSLYEKVDGTNIDIDDIDDIIDAFQAKNGDDNNGDLHLFVRTSSNH